MKLLLKVALALALTVCLFFEGWTLLFDRPTPPQRGVMEQTSTPTPNPISSKPASLHPECGRLGVFALHSLLFNCIADQRPPASDNRPAEGRPTGP